MIEQKKNIYVGHRYVPLISGVWNQLVSYEGLSIVTWEGTSYTSKMRVPEGVSIENTNYWVVTGNYNAQVEEYRQSVKVLENNLTTFKEETETDFSDVALVALNTPKLGYTTSVDTWKKRFESMFINVKDFGAVGDGVTDDTLAIKNALAYIKTIGWGTLFLPEGTFITTETVVVFPYLEIFGVTRYKTILKYTGSGIAITHDSPQTNGNSWMFVDGLRLKNFKVEGTNKTGSIGIHLATGSEIEWIGMMISNFDINVILGASDHDHYILFSTFQFDSMEFTKGGFLLRNIQDCTFPRNLFSGISDLTAEYAVKVGDVIDSGNNASKPLDITFITPVFQMANTGIIHDGGQGISIFGGHSEGLVRQVYQSPNADGGLFIDNHFQSGTVQGQGFQNENGYRFTSPGRSERILDKRIFGSITGEVVGLSATPYQELPLYNVSFKLTPDIFRLNKLRMLISAKGSNTSSTKTIRFLAGDQTILTYSWTGENASESSTWVPLWEINNKNVTTDTNIFMVVSSSSASEEITFNYIDIQGKD